MTLHDLENAVAGLSPKDLEQFRAWFSEFDSDAWDRQIEDDAATGKLDSLAEKAIKAHRQGKTDEL